MEKKEKPRQSTMHDYFAKSRQQTQTKKETKKKEGCDEEMKEECQNEEINFSKDVLTQVDFEQILAEQGYAFKGREMKLVQIKSGDPYQFSSQGEYEFISQLMIKYVQQKMV